MGFIPSEVWDSHGGVDVSCALLSIDIMWCEVAAGVSEEYVAWYVPLKHW